MRLLNSIVHTVRDAAVCLTLNIAHSNLIPSELIKQNLSRSGPIVHVKYLHRIATMPNGLADVCH